MAVHLATQVTIAAGGVSRVTTARTPFYHAIIEADDGNSNPVFIGGSTVTTALGIRLNNSATAPGRLEIGPFSGFMPADLMDIWVAGTAGEKVNILYVG